MPSHCRWSDIRYFDGDEEVKAAENLLHVHGQVKNMFVYRVLFVVKELLQSLKRNNKWIDKIKRDSILLEIIYL